MILTTKQKLRACKHPGTSIGRFLPEASIDMLLKYNEMGDDSRKNLFVRMSRMEFCWQCGSTRPITFGEVPGAWIAPWIWR